jgi:serine protease Do
LGDADKLDVGAWAIAVGYPFGGSSQGGRFDVPQHYEPTITVGVISALNRQIQSESQGLPFRNLVQTDAPINPGNSGGPLLTIRAQVVGINQAIYTSGLSAGNIGVGFAIPINEHTKSVIATLKEGGSFVRGRLGVMVKPLTEAMKNVYGADHGVFVEEVDKDSPADQAGMKNEDVILSYQGKRIDAQDEFVNMVQGTKPGTKAKIEVLRLVGKDEKQVSLTATIGTLAAAAEPKPVAAAESEAMGLTVETIPPEVAEQSGVQQGVRVRAVASLSDGARAGVQPGDLLVRVNRDLVTDVASYEAAVKRLKKGEPVVLRVWRQGHFATLEVSSLSE